MLLTGLQSHAKGIISYGICCDTDYTSRNVTFMYFFGGKVSRVGTAKSHWNAETLAAAYNDIGTPFAWRHKQCQAKQVSNGANRESSFMQLRGNFAVILYHSVAVGILDQYAKKAIIHWYRLYIAHLYFNAIGMCPGLQNIKSLRENIFSDKIAVCSFVFAEAILHKHRFCSGSGLIQ